MNAKALGPPGHLPQGRQEPLRAPKALGEHEMMQAEASEVAIHHPHQHLTIQELGPAAGMAREGMGGPRDCGSS